MAASARARERQEAKRQHARARRPAAATIAAVMMILAGILSLGNSYLILASSIVFGWLIVGIFGLLSITAGVGLFQRADWAYRVGVNFAIMDIFVGFVAVLGAFNIQFAVLGWSGIGQAIGTSILILGAISLFLVTRREVRHYYEGFV